MPDDATPEFFSRQGLILAFMGAQGGSGVFVLDTAAGSVWRFHPANSVIWDSLHQETYRNFKSEPLSVTERQERIPPVPPLPALPAVIRVDWESNFTAIADPALLRCEPLLTRVNAAPGKRLVVYYVLLEDTYESAFGDGVFRDFSGAFLSSEAAAAFANRKGTGASRATVGQTTVVARGEEMAFPEFRPQRFEHVTVDQLIHSLNDGLTRGRGKRASKRRSR